MARATLEIDYDYDFLLFGISCHHKDYRLCWNLNNKLELDLCKEKDFEIEVDNSGIPAAFSFYSFYDPETHLKYNIVSNRGDRGTLIAEQKHADYFLLVEGENAPEETARLLSGLRSIDLVITAFQLDPNQLKSKQNLLFE